MAILDWTSFEHARLLLDGELVMTSSVEERWTFGGAVVDDDLPPTTWVGRCDPFVALGDLASVVSAVILYDRVLIVAARPHHTARVNDLLGIDNVIGCLDPGLTTDTPAAGRLEEELLHRVWQHTWHLLDVATHTCEPWLDAVRDRWTEVLPGVEFPEHSADSSDELGLTYSTSPARPTPVIWQPLGSTYSLRPAAHLAELILDNDVRALFYDELAQRLGPIFGGDEEERALTVRYVGGCLRSPMLLARAGAFLARRSAEGFIAQEWAAATRSRFPVELPLWMDAVLASSQRRSDLPRVVGKLRQDAQRFRRRRAELERELRRGNEVSLERMRKALRDEAAAMSTGIPKVAGALAEIGAAPTGPFARPIAEAAEGVASAAAGPLRRVVDRFRRPELWLIYRVRKQARHGRASLETARELFDLPGDIAVDQPQAFLRRLGTVAWVA